MVPDGQKVLTDGWMECTDDTKTLSGLKKNEITLKVKIDLDKQSNHLNITGSMFNPDHKH